MNFDHRRLLAAVSIICSQNASNSMDILRAGKRTLPLNLKSPGGHRIIRRLCQRGDVLIDPFRPGVLERLGFGPDTLLADNPRLVYARLTGFGQTGPLAARAGHDINYVAMSGILSMLGRVTTGAPMPPVNVLADMAGGGLMCALGICMALLERHSSGRGQIVDASMVEGTAYVASWLTRSQRRLPMWGEQRGGNTLDGGRFFYDCYETQESGKFMSVGALEPQFFAAFVKALGLPELQQHVASAEVNERNREIVAERFRSKTQAEWTAVFEGIDACVFPVLDWREAPLVEHNAERGVYLDGDDSDVAAPAPRLSRTPAVSSVLRSKRCGRSDDDDQSWMEVLQEIGIVGEEVRQLHEDGALLVGPKQSQL